jgi:hypothetical protein
MDIKLAGDCFSNSTIKGPARRCVATSHECFSYTSILLMIWHGPESHLAPEVVLTRSARDVAIGIRVSPPLHQ